MVRVRRKRNKTSSPPNQSSYLVRRVKVQRKAKKENNVYGWILILILLAVIIFLGSFFIKDNNILMEEELDIKLQISNKTGLMVSNESLDFGRIIYSSSGQKYMNIENNFDFPVVVQFNAVGNVSDFLIYEPEIRFGPNEQKRVGVSTIIFTNETYANYSGIMSVVFKKA